MTLKKSFVVLKTTYVRWLLSSRLLIFAFAYMFFYVYFIEPLISLSDYFATPLNSVEPFVSLMNSAYFLPLSALTYLILISDYPKLDDSGTFILFRTGRYAWILGQIWFLICSAMTFISFLLISSMLTVMSRSFLINAWTIYGMASNAFFPKTLGTVGTARQPKNSNPSFLTTVSNIFLTRKRTFSS